MSNIRFKAESHEYLDDEDRDLISVSKFTDRFKQKVDWDTIASNSAKKLTSQGKATSKKDILDKWDRNRAIGTLVHSIHEEELLATESPIFYDTPCEVHAGTHYEGFKNSIPINDLQNNTVYPELMIYDLDYMICGQSDKVIVANNKIHIWDYKTDAEISFIGFSNKWTKPRKLLGPLAHLDDCNGNVYSIKMSLYMYMLWKANKGRFKPGDIVIEHCVLKRDSDKSPILEDGKPIILKTERINLPYRKKEVIAMLKTLK